MIVYATDLSNNTGASDQISFTITAPPADTTPPVITITSPEATTYDTDTVDFVFTVDEEASWIGYSLDGAENVTFSGENTISGLSAESHSVIVYATDLSNNTGASDQISFTITAPPADTTPPVITITSPEATTYDTDTVDFVFTVDEEASWIGYSLDGAENVTFSGENTISGLSAESHSVIVYATDLSNNTGASDQISFTITAPPADTTPPTISIISPEQGVVYNTKNVNLELIINEEASWIEYSLDNSANVSIFTNTTLIGLSKGVHNITIYASDLAGNVGISSIISFSVQTDESSPIIQIISPENSTYFDSVNLNFTINEEVDWIGYNLDNGNNVTILGNTTISSLPLGPHNIVIYSNDTSGNMGVSNNVNFSVEAEPPVDIQPPAITILSPLPIVYSVNTVELDFSINEPTSWIRYSLDFQENTTITQNTLLEQLAEGSHSIIVYATDMSGNTGASNQITFTITIPQTDTTPPSITIDSPHQTNYETSNILLDFSINEPTSWIRYSLDFQENTTITQNTLLEQLAEGSHSIIVYATDMSGNTGASNQITFTITIPQTDTTPPSITIDSPHQTNYETSNILLDFSINEPTSWIRYSLDFQENTTITQNTLLEQLAEGSHSIIVYATDMSGNTGASNQITFTITIPQTDTTPPSITIDSPHQTNYETSNILLDFSINEPTSWIRYSLDFQENTTITQNTLLEQLAEGSHSIIVYATDMSGNTGASNQITFTITIPQTDTTPPTIEIKSPRSTTYFNNNISLSYHVENSNVQYYSLDNSQNVTVFGSIILTNISEGEHSLILYAENSRGRVEASEEVNFTSFP